MPGTYYTPHTCQSRIPEDPENQVNELSFFPGQSRLGEKQMAPKTGMC